MQEIIPKVYLGGKQDALVVNCTPDIPQIERMGVETVRMPIPDGHGDDENSAMAEHLRVFLGRLWESVWSTVWQADRDRRL